MPPKKAPAKTPAKNTRSKKLAQRDPSDYTALEAKSRKKPGRNPSIQQEPDREDSPAPPPRPIHHPAQVQSDPVQTPQNQQPSTQTNRDTTTPQAPHPAQTGHPFAEIPAIGIALDGLGHAAQNDQTPRGPPASANPPVHQTPHNTTTVTPEDTPIPSVESGGADQVPNGDNPLGYTNQSPQQPDASTESQNPQQPDHPQHDAGSNAAPPSRHPSRDSHQSEQNARMNKAPTGSHPGDEPDRGSSSSSSSHSSHGSRKGGRPIRAPRPGGSPDRDPGADFDGPLPPRPRRSFWEVFLDQVYDGMMHLRSKQAYFASMAGFVLLVFQLCSVGRLCYDDDEWCFWKVFNTVTPRLDRYFGTYFCLLGANTLAILGICDLALGYMSVLEKTAARGSSQRPDPTIWIIHVPSVIGMCMPVWRDLCDEAAEPFLILVVMFGLQDLQIFSSSSSLGEVSSPIRLICINGMLHFVKWILQTIEIVWELSPRLYVRRPLVLGFLWTLAIFAYWQHESSNKEDRSIAARYFKPLNFSVYGLVGSVVVGNRAERMPRSTGLNMIRVTHRVVTEWVQPTESA